METGNGRTEDRGGLTRNEENVIRLPRDWLGPPEELVPIGPAARARAAQRDAEVGVPPTADAFWSEDSAALHDAVQAPPPVTPDRVDPPVGLVPPVAGLRAPRLGRVPRVGRGSWLWSVLAVPVAALFVLAVIGSSEGPASRPPVTHTQSSHLTAGARVASTSQATSGAAAAAKLKSRATTRRHVAGHHRIVKTHARTRAQGGHPAKSRHPAASHHPAGSSSPAVTEAAASPRATQSSTATSTVTNPTAATASSSVRRSSKPATTGPPGPTGIGSISGGCSPKCS